jgi:hypothetical protein
MKNLRSLLTPDRTEGPLTPRIYADIRKAGVGPVLLGWEKMTEAEQDYYRTSRYDEGGRLYLSDCNQTQVARVFSTRAGGTTLGAFANQRKNYPVCVPKTLPNGSSCPTPGLAPPLCRPNAGNTCESGFCAADTGVCEDGYGEEFLASQGNDRNDNKGGDAPDNDIGGIQLVQTNQTAIDYAKSDNAAGSTATDDKRNYSVTVNVGHTLEVFGIKPALVVTDLGISVTGRPDQEEGTFAQRAELFGVSVPIGTGESLLASCGGQEWSDGEWEKPECQSIRDNNHLVDPASVSEFVLNLPTPEICKERMYEANALTKPLQRFCVHKQTFVGPVPLVLEAGPQMSASVSFGAEIDKDSKEPSFKVTPEIGLGVEVKGAAGISGSDEENPSGITLMAGAKAGIDVVTLGFPITWSVGIEEGSDANDHAVDGLWLLKYEKKIELELTFLKMSLKLFFEVGVGSLTAEWDYDLLGFDGIKLTWPLEEEKPIDVKADFKWDPLATCPAGAN